jgi:dihydroneopterin aldolase
MTLFLASVRDAAEAELALAAGADIVDLKDPATGALGALAPDVIATCVNQVGARAPVSATIGDLPLKGDAVRKAVLDTAALGVDYVKFGLFPGGDARMCLNGSPPWPPAPASSWCCSPTPCLRSMLSRSPPGSARMA